MTTMTKCECIAHEEREVEAAAQRSKKRAEDSTARGVISDSDVAERAISEIMTAGVQHAQIEIENSADPLDKVSEHYYATTRRENKKYEQLAWLMRLKDYKHLGSKHLVRGWGQDNYAVEASGKSIAVGCVIFGVFFLTCGVLGFWGPIASVGLFISIILFPASLAVMYSADKKWYMDESMFSKLPSEHLGEEKDRRKAYRTHTVFQKGRRGFLKPTWFPTPNAVIYDIHNKRIISVRSNKVDGTVVITVTPCWDDAE